MQIIHSLSTNYEKPIALTIGNFDGIHTGHQKIIQTLRTKAQMLNLDTSIMSFSPHPKYFFGHSQHYQISRTQDKIDYFTQENIDLFFKITFNQNFCDISHTDFIRILCEQFNLKYLLIGDDFRFGKDGLGDYNFLAEASAHYSFVLEQAPTYMWQNKRISSSLIRENLIKCDLKTVKSLLGRDYSFTGTVEKGKQLGQTIGFPTANIKIKPQYLVPQGVFAVYVDIHGKTYSGVSNIGTKPTIGSNEMALETYLFDFSGSLYDKEITVRLIEKIRNEQKFSSLDQLKKQINLDCEVAKKILNRT